MVVQLDRPDRETRLLLTKHLAAKRGLTLNDAALTAVAAQCLASVREMEGALTNLQAMRELSGTTGEVGLMLVQQVFEQESWQPNNPVRIATVIDAVCAHLGVSRAELIGSRRNRQVVTARGLVAYLGREMTSHSYPEIAQEMGRKYHSTVHTAAQRLKRQLREDDTVQLGRGDPPMRMQELVDQVRHSILRGGAGNLSRRQQQRTPDRIHFDQ
jgi:chromosomal replication initiator protein